MGITHTDKFDYICPWCDQVYAEDIKCHHTVEVCQARERDLDTALKDQHGPN